MATSTPIPSPEQPVRLVPKTEEPAKGQLAGDPALVGLPSFIVGGAAFGMVLIGVVPATAVAAAIPIILTAAAGMFLATIWAARIGENVPAGINAIVGSFFLSYSLLVLGLSHNWYLLTPAVVEDTQKVFVISWIIVVTMLVLATLRLPSIYTALFTLVDAALILNLLGIIQSSADLTKAAGWVVLAASAIVVYLFCSSASRSTGGKELPLGRPVLRT